MASKCKITPYLVMLEVSGQFNISVGCKVGLPFTQNIRKLRLERKWKAPILAFPNGKCPGKSGCLQRYSKIPKRNFRVENASSICSFSPVTGFLEPLIVSSWAVARENSVGCNLT